MGCNRVVDGNYLRTVTQGRRSWSQARLHRDDGNGQDRHRQNRGGTPRL